MRLTSKLEMDQQKKIERRRRLKWFVVGAIISAIIFLPLGYHWRYVQTEPAYRELQVKYNDAIKKLCGKEAENGLRQGKGWRR